MADICRIMCFGVFAISLFVAGSAWVILDFSGQAHITLPVVPSDADVIILNDNSIAEIEWFPIVPSLSELELDRNLLTSFPNLENVSGLSILHLQYNYISHIDGNRLAMLTDLVTLSLFSNLLTTVPQAPLNIVTFNMGMNQFDKCPEGVVAPESAMNVILDDNQLTGCYRDFLINANGIRSISFDSNQFTAIPDLWHVKDSLISLQMGNNKIRTISPGDFDYLRRVRNIVLSSNELIEMPDILQLPPSLLTLNLDDNSGMACDAEKLKWINAIRTHGTLAIPTANCFANCFDDITVAAQFAGGISMPFVTLSNALPSVTTASYDFSSAKRQQSYTLPTIPATAEFLPNMDSLACLRMCKRSASCLMFYTVTFPQPGCHVTNIDTFTTPDLTHVGQIYAKI